MNNEEKILAMLEQMQGDIGEMKADMQSMKGDIAGIKQDQAEMRAEMQEGFANLERSINEAAKDSARTEKALREHLEQPHIA